MTGTSSGRGGRGAGVRGRGRGGRGLLGDRRKDACDASKFVSGPFSLGPSASKSSRSSAGPHVGFAPPTRSSSRIAGGGGGGGGRGRANAQGNAASSAGNNYGDDDGNMCDLEKIINIERLQLGEEHCPVHIQPNHADSVMDTDVKPADVLEDPEGLFLFQLPKTLPALQNMNESASEETEGNENNQQNKKDSWPESVEGQYGKLFVHASGKLTMEINGIRYDLDCGLNPADSPHVSGSQAIVAIDPEYEQSFELGPIKNTFIASLDLSSCLE